MGLVHENLDESNVLEGTIVEDTSILNTLRRHQDVWDSYGVEGRFKKLRALGEAVAAGEVSQILFHACMKNTHWAIYSVDVTMRSISYGDSLGWPCPAETIKLLDRWLAKHGIHSLVLGEPLPCTDQAKTGDGTSCGFIAANTIDHLLFRSKFWMPEISERMRVGKLVNIFDSHLNGTVSLSPYKFIAYCN